jgi:hypothetical protein
MDGGMDAWTHFKSQMVRGNVCLFGGLRSLHLCTLGEVGSQLWQLLDVVHNALQLWCDCGDVDSASLCGVQENVQSDVCEGGLSAQKEGVISQVLDQTLSLACRLAGQPLTECAGLQRRTN